MSAESRRAYKTAWARAHRVWKLRQCEQIGCNRLIPGRRHFCDEDRHANFLYKWGQQNARRRRAA